LPEAMSALQEQATSLNRVARSSNVLLVVDNYLDLCASYVHSQLNCKNL